MPGLTLAQQEGLIRLRYAKAKSCYRWIKKEKALWTELTLQPAPIYERYRVCIGYMLGTTPAVFVVSPAPVKEAHGVRTPHLNYDDTLCLFDPGKKQWTAADAIAYTTIPWTLRWLFHYENWLSTGQWLGDTNPPAVKPEEPTPLAALGRPS